MIDRPTAVPQAARIRDRRGEHGTAFVVAMLVLLVLTIAGLALTLMTQTEMRIGANEREANRTFYATDSGIQVSTVRTLWTNNNQPLTILLNTTQQDSGSASAPPLTFEDQIVVTPLYAIHTQPCSFCQINQNQQHTYTYQTSIVNVTTSRLGINNSGTPFTQTLAQQVVSSMIGLQPLDSGGSIIYNPPTNLKY